MSEISFAGKTAIVTGSGRGLGRSHALEFARRGAAVVVNEIRDGLAEKVTEEITSAGGKAVAVHETVATAAGSKHVVDVALEQYGSVDILVNNAGVLRTGYIDQLSEDDIDDVLDVHLRAAFRMSRHVWPIMSEKGYGRIVNTCSNSGMLSHQGLASYAAAKAGLYGLTKALAFEGAEHGIKVNAILPTAMTEAALESNIPDMLEWGARFTRKEVTIPDWRWSPPLISALVTYLCSAECEYSGEAFSAVNGRYAKIFVGVADGWIAPDEASVSTDSIAAHMGEIRDLSNHSVPMWLFEEMRDVAERLDASGLSG